MDISFAGLILIIVLLFTFKKALGHLINAVTNVSAELEKASKNLNLDKD